MSNMFERPLYEFEPGRASVPEHPEMFRDYEVKGWLSSNGLFKIIGISAVANIVALLVVGQTSLLTMKGCDSPLVGSVCQVLDTVYVGSLLFGTDRDVVDAAYDKIDLDDEDITFIDASNVTPQLEYPATFVDMRTGSEVPMFPPKDAPIEDTAGSDPVAKTKGIPGIPDGMLLGQPLTNGNSLIDTPQNVPPHNPKVIDESTLPRSSGGGTKLYWPTPKKAPNKRPPLEEPTPEEGTAESNPEPGSDPAAGIVAIKRRPSPATSPSPGPSVEPIGPVDSDEINTRPFKDLAIEVNDLLDQKQIDLQAPIKVLATAKLGKDGKIAKGSFKVTAAAGNDKNLVTVVTHAVGAFNDSNLLNYLKDLSGKNLNFLVQQDETTIAAAVKSEVESETRAQAIATALKFGISLAVQKKEKGIADLEAANDPAKAQALQNLKDDLDLLKSTQ